MLLWGAGVIHHVLLVAYMYVCTWIYIYIIIYIIYICIIWSLERNRELYCGKTRKTIHHGRLSWRLSSWAEETCIIFDWDDTLLPTSFIEDAAWLRLLWFFQFIHVNYPIMLSAQVCVGLESLIVFGNLSLDVKSVETSTPDLSWRLNEVGLGSLDSSFFNILCEIA